MITSNIVRLRSTDITLAPSGFMILPICSRQGFADWVNEYQSIAIANVWFKFLLLKYSSMIVAALAGSLDRTQDWNCSMVPALDLCMTDITSNSTAPPLVCALPGSKRAPAQLHPSSTPGTSGRLPGSSGTWCKYLYPFFSKTRSFILSVQYARDRGGLLRYRNNPEGLNIFCPSRVSVPYPSALSRTQQPRALEEASPSWGRCLVTAMWLWSPTMLCFPHGSRSLKCSQYAPQNCGSSRALFSIYAKSSSSK